MPARLAYFALVGGRRGFADAVDPGNWGSWPPVDVRHSVTGSGCVRGRNAAWRGVWRHAARGDRTRCWSHPEGLPAAVTVTLAIGVAHGAETGYYSQVAGCRDAGQCHRDLFGQNRHTDPEPDDGAVHFAGGHAYHVTGSGYSPRRDHTGRRPDAERQSGAGGNTSGGCLCNDSGLTESGEYGKPGIRPKSPCWLRRKRGWEMKRACCAHSGPDSIRFPSIR